MSYVDTITHYDSPKSNWQVSHWKTKWEHHSKAIVKWKKIDLNQDRPVPEWEWENISESAARALIKKEDLKARGPTVNRMGSESVKVPKKRGRPKKDA